MSEDKPFVKDAKILMIEEHFNDELEDLLWRLRQIEERTFQDISEQLSTKKFNVSVEDVASWLSYLNIDTIVERKLIKNPSVPVRPKKKSQTNQDKLLDPRTAASELCSDKCAMAAFCKFFERYEGKKCIVDLQTKSTFLAPLQKYIDKTYDRDADLRALYGNLADQVASIYQVMKRKERLLNIRGVTQIERKVDPTSGKVIENEVPNPLAGAILSDSKQIMAMLKELGMTPKSMAAQDTGESDPASLSRALDVAERKHKDEKAVRALKQDRYKNRPEITSKEQLLELIQEKIRFDKALSAVEGGEMLPERVDLSEKIDEDDEELGHDKILSDNEPQDVENQAHRAPKRIEAVDVPEDVLAIIGRIKKTEENNNG